MKPLKSLKPVLTGLKVSLVAVTFMLLGAAITTLFFMPQTGMADTQQAYTSPQLSNPISRGVQGIFGINRMAAWIGERQLQKQIHKKVEGDIHVKIRPYSGFDLMAGKARQLSITGKHLLYNKTFYVSDLDIETDPQTPVWIDPHSGKLKSPLKTHFTIGISQEDMNKSLNSGPLKKQLSQIKIHIPGGMTQTFELLNPHVDFEPGKIHLTTRVNLAGLPESKSLPIDLETGLAVDPDGQHLHLQNLHIKSLGGITDSEIINSLVKSALQWVLTPTKLIPLKGSDLRIQSITIEQKYLRIQGHVLLLPQVA